MGLLDFLKKDKKSAAAQKAPEVKALTKKAEEKKDEEKKSALVSAKKKNTKDAYKVLLKPLITEKATATGAYFFAVKHDTTKQEVKKAVQAAYGVKPQKVNIINYGAKKVRWGRVAGNQKAWKKAIVYLKPGENIEVYGN
jgi:large subunit ribosomal protein L23